MKQEGSHTIHTEQKHVATSNHLFPVFLKLESLKLLIVGGGNVGLEKLNAVLVNAPATKIKLVAIDISDSIKELAGTHHNLDLHERAFEESDLEATDLVIIAINDKDESQRIRNLAKDREKLVNVADKPELCDFYLSSIVKKGNLKIAISTNGKSPTIAKRLKETFDEVLPGELDAVLDNMQSIRNKLNGDFSAKVNKLNKITHVLATGKELRVEHGEKWWKKVATWSLFAFLFMIIGHGILSYVPLSELWQEIKTIELGSNFLWLVGAGFLAQLVDGALGMGYGVTCTTILLSQGVALPAISGSIHTAEMFSSGVSGYSHYKFGNVNKKLFKVLLIPGIIGAVIGAFMLSKLGDQYADYIKPILATYTFILGIRILFTAFRKKTKPKKVKHAGWLAGAGGFLDSFGGGGWGPLVTSTLISKGRTPRYVIGSVSITEFFVTLASALTFFSLIGLSHWQVIAGLIVGGMLGAPLAAKLSGKLPVKTMFICVGAMVIFWSLRILIKALF
ncbi:TSUP family transporter [Chitinophagaceae bacterium LB-8]|uniref:Probable membrane transporter protein n=1 Tax=Paraflavisolibacter caeni TaxID=2982496 RepID=A0A9X2XY82_9BACT|nr:TSUP family transporter [Paraflavisolibacter caeni]MCU7550787.1 TSUP family transporter [Paraflavisolibacter caeni]